MSPDTFTTSYGFRPTDFVPPKQISLSPEALSEARQFLSELESQAHGTKWIVAFTWCYDRTLRRVPILLLLTKDLESILLAIASPIFRPMLSMRGAEFRLHS